MGIFQLPCEGQLVCLSSITDKVPKFNSAIYNDKKIQLGKIDEVFGRTDSVVIYIPFFFFFFQK